VFIPAVGEYVIPRRCSGRTDQIMIGRVLSDEFFENRDWPVASAVAILILLLLVVPIMLFQRPRAARSSRPPSEGARPVYPHPRSVLGLVFLYLPILSMIVFSFNNSRLVTVWDTAHSPTLKWYVALMSNEQILRAAWLSIRIAADLGERRRGAGDARRDGAGRASAPSAGRMLLAGMTTAPIVMPEVITGLSLLLLLFVSMGQLIGWPKGVGGGHHHAFAHITFCMAYVNRGSGNRA